MELFLATIPGYRIFTYTTANGLVRYHAELPNGAYLESSDSLACVAAIYDLLSID